jgi:hypothetical protein
MDSAKAAAFVAARERVVSAIVSLQLAETGRTPPRWEQALKAGSIPDPGDPPPVGCQSITTLTTAQSTAKARTQTAYWACAYSNLTWYRTWFGSTDGTYLSTVTNRFGKSYWALDSTITYDCDGEYCSPYVVAYVFKNQPYKIWICDAFWTESASYQAHAIAHETFHWYEVAGVDDIVYGESACRSLAQSDPYDALRNADSYAYAADNAYY